MSKKQNTKAAMPNTSWNQIRLEELQEWYQSACKGRQEAQTQVALLQAHAEALAEALRGMMDAFAYNAEQTVANEGESALQSDVRRAREALANWEGAKS
jgi:hypothetical protein